MLVLAVCASAIHAQNTTELMMKAEKACMIIRDAVTARSADNVMAGMEMISEIPFCRHQERRADARTSAI